MSYTEPPPGTAPTGASSSTADASLGTLVSNLSQQMSTLVRDEIRLAQAEVTQKGKQAGIGLGLFSVAGLLAFYGVATLIATAVLALALAIDAWLAALVVGVVLLAAAGVAGVMGKGKVRQAGPPKPEQAIAGLKEDVATLKGDRS
jgi:putative superfamily III holin-X